MTMSKESKQESKQESKPKSKPKRVLIMKSPKPKSHSEDAAEAVVWLLFIGLVIVCICIGVLTSEIIGWLVFGGAIFVLGLICAVICCMEDK
jgi:Trk-type K+ transport system membrane component